MDSTVSNGTIPTVVEVVEACGEWFVRVVEDGKEYSRSFELESYALAFAEGQRMRLHLDKVVRL
ncbi:hypothetical protein [Mesorhizobium huakuii]|uniref:Uncharacterized protein n=1 Tax=Mesorhizobium huakuii TaxID=28104 RepID=A0A7G6T1E9_9HYPH|nr:hypothetical protein [Mesorhizobium huakuii]QND60581.1 hypothetical protein HB778_31700 [Mesorhizobium huakuii]